MVIQQQSHLVGHRYQIVEQIGVGGMGVVFRAIDRLTGQAVALKRVTVLDAKLENVPAEEHDTLRLALAQEFRTLASLRHPNIISVLDYGFELTANLVKQPYFTMELLENPRTIIAAGEDLPIDEQVMLLTQMMQALAYLHRRGIIHRDLKPDNVMVVNNPDGTLQVKVLDFGLAVARGHVSEEDQSGTLAYMAPELLQGSAPSEASDLYASGIIAYQLFAGEHPFDTTNIMQLIRSIVSDNVDFMQLAIDPALQEVGTRLTFNVPEERYRSAQAVIQEFSKATGQTLAQESETIRESYLQAARFVGREREMTTLTSALKRIIIATDPNAEIDDLDDSELGAIWLIGGESGVGKSRLLEELRAQALVEGALALTGQASKEQSSGYGMWNEVLRLLCLQITLSSEEIAILESVVPDIATLVELEPAHEANKLDTQSLLDTIEIVFRRQTRPVLLILEDLQWMTEGSFAILRHLMRIVSSLPLLILASYRNDESPHLLDKLPNAHYMELERLPADKIAYLSESMIGEAGRNKSVLEMLERETEGNIFFIVEVVRALAEETGELSEVGRKTLPPRIFAEGMKSVVQRRLEGVPEEARPLLYAASIIGRELDLDLLQMLESPMDFGDWLFACEMAIIIEVHDNRWRFTHDKLREGLIDEIGPTLRQRLHREVAEAIETHYGDDPAQAYRLFGHWREAGDAERELHYLLQVADLAMASQEDYERVIVLLERAITLTRLLPAQIGDDAAAQYVNLLWKLGYAYFKTAQVDVAEQNLNEAFILAEAHNLTEERGQILGILGALAARAGDYETALSLWQENLTIQQAGDDGQGIVAAMRDVAEALNHLERYDEAAQIFEEALVLARSLNAPIYEADLLSHRADMAFGRGDHQQAQVDYTHSAEIYEAQGKREPLAGIYLKRARLALAVDALDATQDYLTEALYLVHLEHQPHFVAEAISLQAQVYAADSAPEKAVEYAAAVINQAESQHLDILYTMLEELQASLPDMVYASALEMGQKHTLNAITAEILTQHASTD